MDDLFAVRTRGRAPIDLSPAVVRDLTRGDLAALEEEKGSTTPALKRISDRHHALARNLAGGMKEAEAALVCGISNSRISILKNDPQFQELLEFYRGEVDLVYRDMHEKLAGVASIALDELQERLEDTPEKVSMGHLMEVVKLGADRTGFGPQSSTTNLNVNVDMAARLNAARERVRQRQQTIEHE